jgi:hypothetical protein
LEGKREVMIGASASNQEEVIREDEATGEGANELKTLRDLGDARERACDSDEGERVVKGGESSR